MTDITKEMQEIIENSLPAATAGAMSAYIAEAEKTKETLSSLKKSAGQLSTQIDRLRGENAALNEKLESQDDLARREKELEDQTEALRVRERDIQLEVIQNQLASANDSRNTVERLVEKVFGHPSVTVSTYKDVVVPVEGSNGVCGYAHKENGVMESETTTQGKS